MSDSLISGDSKPSLAFSFRMLASSFGLQNKLQVACVKAASNEPGAPKAKHVAFIIESLKNGGSFEDILVAFDALTEWRKHRLVSIKVLGSLVQIFQKVPEALNHSNNEALSIFLTLLFDFWVDDAFIRALCSCVRNKMSLSDFALYSTIFNNHLGPFTSTQVAQCNNEDICSFISLMLSGQDILIQILHINFELGSGKTMTAMNDSEVSTLLAHSQMIHDESCHYINSIAALLRLFYKSVLPPISKLLLSTFQEQFDAQYGLLEHMFYKNTADEQQPLVEHISIPRVNPLLSDRKGQH
jgi:hypothetical protein